MNEETSDEINNLIFKIDNRIYQLRAFLQDQEDHAGDRIVGLAMGECDGLKWVKEKLEKLKEG